MGGKDGKPDPEDGQVEKSAAQKLMGIINSIGMIIAFCIVVGMETPTNKARAQTKAIEGYSRPPSANVVITVMTFVMLTMSLVISLVKYGPGCLKVIYGKKQVLDFIPFSLCFALCNAPKSISAEFLAADVQKVMTSMKTVFAAILFGVTKYHKYSSIQKLMLVIITMIVIAYTLQNTELADLDKSNLKVSQAKTVAAMQKENTLNDADGRIMNCVGLGMIIPTSDKNDLKNYMGSPSVWDKVVAGEEIPATWTGCSAKDSSDKGSTDTIIGVCLISFHLALHATGSWFGEKALKKGKDVPYLMQKSTEMSIAMVVCLLQLFVVYPFIPASGLTKDIHDYSAYNGEWINGWGTVGLWAYFIVLFSRHFLSGIIVKNMDTIVKQVCSNASFMIVYWVSVWWASIVVKTNSYAANDDKNKYGFAYDQEITFIAGSTAFDFFKFFLLCMVTVICLGYAVVSKYTKCKNKWKKMYNELKEMENNITGPDGGEAAIEAANEEERQRLLAQEQTLPQSMPQGGR